MGLISQKSFLGLFLIISVLFICSWFYVLKSTGRPHFVNSYILPKSKIIAASDNRLVVENTWRSLRFGSDRKEILKVFMYDLPPEFHFALTGWKPKGKNVWPDLREEVPQYPGGLNLQHSIEYWLTMDLLSSEYSDNFSGRSAIRVRNSSEADVIFVPFFSSISYNRFKSTEKGKNTSIDDLLQEKLVTILTSQEEWKRSGGRDHIIFAHHPNSLLDARAKLYPAVYILSDFGRYSPTVANVEKDVIAPYKHVVPSFSNDSSTFDSRPTLLYFQGSIYRKDVSGSNILLSDILIS
ncbi:glycosyltransferase [Lithospermum erythrorhizon]|uniref:Glycosyltransferase n=1 Tax=Lithospermum erythrorhizon TaxID=34254 RepID=A0AAV3RK04_LITER